MHKKITLDLIKSEAKQLKTKNPTLKHYEALNDISQKYGYKSYQVLKGVLEKHNGSILTKDPMKFIKTHLMISNDGVFYDVEFPFVGEPDGHGYVTQSTSLGMSCILREDRKEQIMNAGGRIIKRELKSPEDIASLRNSITQFTSKNTPSVNTSINREMTISEWWSVNLMENDLQETS